MTNRQKLIPLIDADILVYRLGFAADARAKATWPGNFKDVNYKTDVFNLVELTMERITNNEFPLARQSHTFLSGKTNFRNEVATIKKYKGNRDNNEKPKYYKEIRDYLTSVYGAEIIEGMEADDALGIAQTEDTCIVSIDKDLDMIEGHHYNFVKGEHYFITEIEGHRNFFRQMLQGDSTDNIPGITGIGPKTALKIIDDNCTTGEALTIVHQKYHEAFKEDAEWRLSEIANLLWIRRKEEEWCPFYDKPKLGATAPRYDPPKVKVSHASTQVEDEATTGEPGSEVGIREESPDQTTGDEDTIQV